MMTKCGFEEVEELSTNGMDRDWLGLLPILTTDFLDLMFNLLPEERHQDTILAVFLKGYKH